MIGDAERLAPSRFETAILEQAIEAIQSTGHIQLGIATVRQAFAVASGLPKVLTIRGNTVFW